MKKLIARVLSPFAWTYRPESMRPAMRKRLLFGGFEQCQVLKAGKWVKAEHPASRYQWKPMAKRAKVIPTEPLHS